MDLQLSISWPGSPNSMGRFPQLQKAPNTKLQAPEKHQTKVKSVFSHELIRLVGVICVAKYRSSKFGAWSFSGAWMLELGAFLSGASPQQKDDQENRYRYP